MSLNQGDTAFVLLSAALVMIMTPGLGFFYGGLVRKKNVLAIMMQCFIALALISVLWVLWGYSLAFGPDINGFIGSLEWIGLIGVGLEPYEAYSSTIPHQAFMIFQAMFAIITPALITGAFADRMKFSSYLLFLVLWSTFVYAPIAHWVWGGGWLSQLGALDFAGGTVVHINAGVASLAAILIIGKRKGFGKEQMPPHNIPFVILGTALLWFGWFGFNAGSALAANSIAANAFVVTNTAAATAGLTWLIVGWLHKGTPSVIGLCTGAVAGLVAITPAAGFVGVLESLAIGMLAGLLCYGAVLYKNKKRLDDALDVWAVHGIGGTWGAIATGIFASLAVNEGGANGLIYGNPTQLYPQLIGVLATWVYSFIITWLILKLIEKIVGLRVARYEEDIGLDIAQHAEEAYVI